MKIKICLFIALIGMISCNSKNEKNLPNITGKQGELLVVADKFIWESAVGDTLKYFLNQAYPAIPQIEPVFDIVNIPSKAFNSIFNTHRNIILVQLKKESNKTEILVQQDAWAFGQLVFNIQSNHPDSMLQLIIQKAPQLITAIENKERDRTRMAYSNLLNKEVIEKVKTKSGIEMAIPKSFQLNVDSLNFTWLTSESNTTIMGIFIYTYPYKDSSDFIISNAINQRNEFLKKYVPGPQTGSYMTTEMIMPPLRRELNLNNKFANEIRGLWKVQNGFMGGAFVSLQLVNEGRDKIICIEGFLYSPKEKKRNQMRYLESILYSAKW